MSAVPQRAVLVTGGAKRLGAAFVRELAGAGWRVVIHYGTSGAEAEALAREVGGSTVGADLTDLDSVSGIIAKASETIGVPLRGLVNSASVFDHDEADSVTSAALTNHFAVNAAAPVLLTRAFAAQVPVGDACVVNILDQKLWSPNPDHLSYTLSKAALSEATRLCAQGLAPHVRVVGVAPGYCLPNPAESDESFAARADRHNLLQARLEPTEVAKAVRFALECRAVTGSTILADNGEHLIASDRDVVFQ